MVITSSGGFVIASTHPPLAAAERGLTLDTPTGTLAGTLSMPAERETDHVVFIISGSGPTDRDGNSPALPGKNNSLKLLAAGLNGAGLATLRVDKRGIGDSVATPERNLRFETYVDDGVAWLDHLKSEFGFRRFSIVGHSEGSLVGMLVAESFPVGRFVSLEGAGHTAQETIVRQLRAQLPAPLLAEVKEIIDRLAAGGETEEIPASVAAIPALATMFRPDVQPYLMAWFEYDPAAVLARLDIPILIVQGTTDLQVGDADAQRLVAANDRTHLAEIAGMNHVLKLAPIEARTNMATYGDPNLPLAPTLVPTIARFLTGPDQSL